MSTTLTTRQKKAHNNCVLNILLNNIACSFSFDVYVTNNLSQEFKCTIYIDIPLDLDNQSIYNGNITLKKDTNFNFYRYR